MSGHRFREFSKTESTDSDRQPSNSSTPPAFMAWPGVLLPQPLSHVEYLYRLAFEHAQAQVARDRKARRVAFSLN